MSLVKGKPQGRGVVCVVSENLGAWLEKPMMDYRASTEGLSIEFHFYLTETTCLCLGMSRSRFTAMRNRYMAVVTIAETLSTL